MEVLFWRPSCNPRCAQVEILASLQKPKKISLKGSDGRSYTMMCKPKDDLRKDCRLMEFNCLINKVGVAVSQHGGGGV